MSSSSSLQCFYLLQSIKVQWDFLTNYGAKRTKVWKGSRNRQLLSLPTLLMHHRLLAGKSKDTLLKENQSTNRVKV